MSIISKKYSEREITKDIIEYITANRLTVDTKLASAKHMAERYNVSPMTVNRAISKLVLDGIVYRHPGSGTFVGKVVPGRSHIKVKVFNWQYNENDPLESAAYGTFYNTLIKGLEDFGFNVSISAKPPFHNKIFAGEHVEVFDLLIVPGGMITSQTVSLLKRMQTPIVLIGDHKLSPWPFHQIFHDYAPGFEKALNYIKSIGFKKIFIACTDGETSNYRSDILQQCAKQAKMTYEKLPFMHGIGAINPQYAILSGRRHGKYCIEHKLEGVIFSVSDFIAWGILDVFRENNIEAGKNIKLISYDNLEGHGVYFRDKPVLTSIKHPLEQLAASTVEMVEFIVGRKVSSDTVNHIVRVPASELIIRSSA